MTRCRSIRRARARRARPSLRPQAARPRRRPCGDGSGEAALDIEDVAGLTAPSGGTVNGSASLSPTASSGLMVTLSRSSSATRFAATCTRVSLENSSGPLEADAERSSAGNRVTSGCPAGGRA